MNRLLSIALVCLLQVSLAVASTFNLTVEVTPDGAASLNTSGGTYEEGSNVYLRTYANTGFVFKGWYEGETLLSSATSFNYAMPSHDVTVQARYEYDPTVPGNPAMPDTTTYYLLTAQVSPTGAGSLNTTSGKYAAGAKVNMRAYANTGFQFVGWQNEVGETVSTATSFNYTMPYHDSQLTALFNYDPTVPANPDSMATQYKVTVACKPVGGGTFNTTNAVGAEGSNVRLYAYTNTGYRFLRWENEQGETISTAQNFYYVIPHGNSKVYGIFEYDPALPGNPGKNYWNKELGEVIVDDFTPGGLNSAVSAVISGSDRSEVAMITVAGTMNDNDFGIANNYTNCTLLDLSRVTGVTEVPSYAFDNTNLETVYLPATIEKIGYRAFYNCKQLSSLIVYAMTPPTLDRQVFTNVPEGLVVYVPAAAISQYQDADGWKDFTILPIQEDIRSITINLPEGVNGADYAKMWLELTNTKNGQRMHYVMTDRTQYTFANIIRNTSWNIVLRNERGDVFGQIDNVEVKDEDVSVTFASLSKPQTVVLTVLTADGKDVTAQTQISWIDQEGNYMAQGATLAGLPAGYQVNYRVTLSQQLAMEYDTPETTAYTFTDGNNAPVCQLQAIKKVQMAGKVKDMATGLPLDNAVISASQTFGGKYTQTLSTKTDKTGQYSIEVSNVPTSLAIAATDYVSKTINCDSLMTGKDVILMSDVALRSITGAIINLTITFKPCEGQKHWYDDYQNVDYELVNKTKNKAISQFNVQYPQIVLLEEVDDGDVLSLTATSRNNAFMPTTTTATINEQKAFAEIDLVELGKIRSTYQSTGNASVVGSLYDATGKLLKTYDYEQSSLTISNLPDGSYSLLSMGSSRLFNSIYDLAQLAQTGLVENVDYVVNKATVESGKITAIDLETVPTLDESKLYYTGDNTSFTVNKPSLVAGNYLTLTGRIDFKSAYATSVSNVQMIIDLPESCEFVENSVMVGNSTSSYTLSGNRITIPMVRYTDRVRFCIIPTLGGEYAPSAFAQFDLDGETITQPIGSASYTAKDLSISVPGTVAKTTIPVSGTAIGTSHVEIYDNGMLIGQTTSLANGTWATTCELNEPYNLSTHSIYAKVTTKAGLELQSETMECMYDKNAIQVSKVVMYHDNPEQHKTYEVVFDFMNPSEKTSTYVYYIYNKEFTFTIDFTNNDPEKVSNVVLFVKTGNDGKWRGLKATYDEKKQMWVAAGQFGNMYDGNIPVNVKVSYDIDSEPVVDAGQFNDLFNLKDGIQEVLNEEDVDVDNLIAQYDAAIAADDEEKADELLHELMTAMGYGEVDPDEAMMDETELQQLKSEVQEEVELMMAALNNFSNQSIYLQDEVNKYMEGVTIEHAPNLTPEQLLEMGYEKVSKSDDTFYYVLMDDSGIHFVDFASDVHIIMANTDAAAIGRRASGEWLDKVRNMCMTIESWCTTIMGTFDDCVNRIGKAIANNEKLLAEAQKALANKKKLKLSKSEVKALQESISKYSKEIKHCKHLKKALNEKVRPYIGSGTKTGSKIAGKVFTIFSLAVDAWDCYKKLSKLYDIKNNIFPPCEKAEKAAASLENDVDGWIVKAGVYYVAKLGADIAELAGFSGGLLGLIPSGGTSLTAILAAAAVMVGNLAASFIFDWRYDVNYKRFCKEYKELYKLCDKEPCDGKTPCPPGSEDEEGNGDDAQESGNPDSNPQIDPSGYVYEGVASNRIEGATATVFYKETYEDMYGDVHENIVKWNAEEYAQENPLFTDENGMYRWDVPQGLWQVKFEKEGYETTYSDWLPVPPPQLDVNIAMKQNIQPMIKNARAFEEGVEVEFDKYMMPELLTAENIIVMQKGTPVEGTVELLNEEVSYEGKEETFASKVRFNAAAPFSEQEVTLLVNNRVKSYAGVRMQDNYEQAFAVEQEIKQIVSDSLKVVTYGESSTLVVQVLPAAASKGKVLTVKTSSAMILGVETEQVTIGEDGKAEITISGELPGTAALTFTVEGTDKEGLTIVSVEVNKIVATPTASIASGTVVEKDTQVELSCATEGATIYYTLDGSCPCADTDARKVYDGTPITIEKNTVVKAMAAAPDMEESAIATFVYIVTRGDVNNDGEVNVGDIVTICNVMAGISTIDPQLADVNGDGEVNVGDIVTICNIMAGKG